MRYAVPLRSIPRDVRNEVRELRAALDEVDLAKSDLAMCDGALERSNLRAAETRYARASRALALKRFPSGASRAT